MANNLSPLPQLAEEVFSEIETNLQGSNNNKQLSDQDLLKLHSIFGATLQRGLEVLDKHSSLLFYYTVNEARVLIEIKGENDRCYRVFPKINYCPCVSFKHQVIERKTQVTCKHVIAARIALILQKITPNEITKDQYLMLLKSMFALEEHKQPDQITN